MAKVRFLQRRVVQDGSGTVYEAGQVVNLPPDSCEHWVSRGIAEYTSATAGKRVRTSRRSKAGASRSKSANKAGK